MDRRDHDDPEPDDRDPEVADRTMEPDDDDALDSDEDDDAVDSVAAADDESDDDESDDDESDDDESDDDDDESRAPAPRRSLGPTLVMLGGGVWAIAAALHCGAPEPGPSLSVSPDAATEVTAPQDDDPQPADAAPRLDGDDEDDAPSADDPEPAADAVDRPDDEDIDDEPLPPPVAEDWATELSPPSKVAYTIRRGGSIKNVANLFKIYHHEITALNPGIALEQELPPNSKVVVYLQEDDESSESVGIPSGGTLEGAVPMVEGPGRHLKAIPWKSWATAHTVALLDRVLRRWAQRGKNVQPVLVGNMSARTGGRLEPHSTHQSGRDADLGYLQKLPEGEELNWRSMTKENLDAGETWALLELLHSTGEIEVIFIDSSIQKLLYDYAIANSTKSKSELAGWLEYPRSPPQRRALVQHVKGHIDHMHVRFSCQPHEKRCKSRQR